LCEVGDLSGKFGRQYDTAGNRLFSSKGTLVDYQPPYNANYADANEVSNMWTSVVFHCGKDASRLVCGKITVSPPTAIPSVSPSFSPTRNPTEADSEEQANSSGDDNKKVTESTSFIAGISVACVVVVIVIAIAIWYVSAIIMLLNLSLNCIGNLVSNLLLLAMQSRESHP
jgi:hypothetical protein